MLKKILDSSCVLKNYKFDLTHVYLNFVDFEH
jgi:hypothetical protein